MTMLDVLKQSLHHDDTCYAIDYLDLAVSDSLQNLLNNDPLELCLMNGEQEQTEDLAVRAMLTQLNNTPNWKNEGH